MATRNTGGPEMSRRGWLCTAGAAAVGAAGLPLLPTPLRAEEGAVPPRVSPDEALRMLLEGNERFAVGAAHAPNLGLRHLRELAEKQTPFASILSCSDSRVPPEILFDRGFGELFVARVAGNIASAEVIGSLEFGTRVLGSAVLMVLGHTACGAVKATLEMSEVPGQIGSLFPYIYPAAEAVAKETPAGGASPLVAVVERNVRYQAEILRRSSPVIAALIREGKLRVVGGVFHFSTGRVELVET